METEKCVNSNMQTRETPLIDRDNPQNLWNAFGKFKNSLWARLGAATALHHHNATQMLLELIYINSSQKENLWPYIQALSYSEFNFLIYTQTNTVFQKPEKSSEGQGNTVVLWWLTAAIHLP